MQPANIKVYLRSKKLKVDKSDRDRWLWTADAMDDLAAALSAIGVNSGHAEAAAKELRTAIQNIDDLESDAGEKEALFVKGKKTALT